VTHQPIIVRSTNKSFFWLVERLIFAGVKVCLVQEPLRQGVCIAEGEDAQSSVVPTVRVHWLERIPWYRPSSPSAASVHAVEISAP